MNEPLRPVEIKKYENEHEASVDGKTTSTKGFFHRWADKHARVGERELGGPCAIVEAKNGQVVLVELGPTVSMRFTDVGPVETREKCDDCGYFKDNSAEQHHHDCPQRESLEDVKCETCFGGPNTTDCKDCDGTGWVKKVRPTFSDNNPIRKTYNKRLKRKEMDEARKKGLTITCGGCKEEFIIDDKHKWPTCPKCNP